MSTDLGPTDAASFDSVVIGAGPAGLAAAAALTGAGRRCALIDMGHLSGGQFWRHPEPDLLAATGTDEGLGHHHWGTYRRLRESLDRAVTADLLDYRPGTQVWAITPLPDGAGFDLHLTAAVTAVEQAPTGPGPIRTRTLLLATGAYDRQLPFPGWTLPGVMAAGGVQALIKGHRVLAGRRAVVAGTGPFLLPVAANLARAGAASVTVCEANSLARWGRDPWGAIQEPGKGLEGVEYAGTFLRHRIGLRTRTTVVAALGDERVEAVRLARLDATGTVVPGTEREVEADLVATGWGFTPSLELPLALDADVRVCADGSLVVDVDADQRTSVAGVFAAGEITGVGGATQALAEGELAGLSVLAELGTALDDRRRGKLRRRVARGSRFAAAMHAATPVPAHWSSWLTDDTLICRCEEVTYGALRALGEEVDATEPRTLRIAGRPGMGMCQGRVCGYAVGCLGHHGPGAATADELAALGRRPLATPVRLGELADPVVESSAS